MSKLVSSFDFISLRSFKKKNLCSFSGQLLLDLRKLSVFFHKILYLRLLSYKLDLFFSLKYFNSKIININIFFSSFSIFFFFIQYYIYFFFSMCFFFFSVFCFFSFFFSFFYSFFFSFFFFLYFFYYRYFFFSLFFFSFLSYFFFYRIGFASIPTRIKKFTVLRSPHIDKKSREQFELRIHKRIIKIPSAYSDYFYYICYLSYNLFLCHYTHTFFCEYEELI